MITKADAGSITALESLLKRFHENDELVRLALFSHKARLTNNNGLIKQTRDWLRTASKKPDFVKTAADTAIDVIVDSGGVRRQVRPNLLDYLTKTSVECGDDATRHHKALLAARAAVRYGFSGNRFDGINTPVGMSAYSGDAELLEMFAKEGADLIMRLAPEHCGGSKSLEGSSLMQRVAERLFGGGGGEDMGVLRVLVKHTPDSLFQTNANGMKPAECARMTGASGAHRFLQEEAHLVMSERAQVRSDGLAKRNAGEAVRGGVSRRRMRA